MPMQPVPAAVGDEQALFRELHPRLGDHVRLLVRTSQANVEDVIWGRSPPVIDVIRPTQNGVIRTVICSVSSMSSVSAGPSFPFPAALAAIRQHRGAAGFTCQRRATPAILGC